MVDDRGAYEVGRCAAEWRDEPDDLRGFAGRDVRERQVARLHFVVVGIGVARRSTARAREVEHRDAEAIDRAQLQRERAGHDGFYRAVQLGRLESDSTSGRVERR